MQKCSPRSETLPLYSLPCLRFRPCRWWTPPAGLNCSPCWVDVPTGRSEVWYNTMDGLPNLWTTTSSTVAYNSYHHKQLLLTANPRPIRLYSRCYIYTLYQPLLPSQIRDRLKRASYTQTLMMAILHEDCYNAFIDTPVIVQTLCLALVALLYRSHA